MPEVASACCRGIPCARPHTTCHSKWQALRVARHPPRRPRAWRVIQNAQSCAWRVTQSAGLARSAPSPAPSPARGVSSRAPSHHRPYPTEMSAKDLLRRLLRPWQQPASPTGDPSRSFGESLCESGQALWMTRHAQDWAPRMTRHARRPAWGMTRHAQDWAFWMTRHARRPALLGGTPRAGPDALASTDAPPPTIPSTPSS